MHQPKLKQAATTAVPQDDYQRHVERHYGNEAERARSRRNGIYAMLMAMPHADGTAFDNAVAGINAADRRELEHVLNTDVTREERADLIARLCERVAAQQVMTPPRLRGFRFSGRRADAENTAG